jgi:hypothetical protein
MNLNFTNRPVRDPHAGWCGRGGRGDPAPLCRSLKTCLFVACCLVRRYGKNTNVTTTKIGMSTATL